MSGKPGDRVVDAGEPGVLLECPHCGGDGVVFQPDVEPPAVDPVDEVHPCDLSGILAEPPPPLHNLLMPHDTRYGPGDVRGCPPNCPYRLAAEGRQPADDADGDT